MRRVLRQRLRDKHPVHLMSGQAGQATKNASVCQQSEDKVLYTLPSLLLAQKREKDWNED